MRAQNSTDSSTVTSLTPTHTPTRRRLPDDRNGVVHKFSVGGFEGFLRVGLFPDGSLGEIFIEMSKSGSLISGMTDAFATVLSMALQYGVPIEVVGEKFIGSRFEPNGFTGNPEIAEATSILDYVFRYLCKKFPSKEHL